MSYNEFLKNIDKYVGKRVKFHSRFKDDGTEFKTERYVWDSKEFGELAPDALKADIMNYIGAKYDVKPFDCYDYFAVEYPQR